MDFKNAYDTVKSDEMFNGESAPAAAEINTIAAAEVFVAGAKPDVSVESEAAAAVESYEEKFEEIEKEMDAIYGAAKTEMGASESYDPGVTVAVPSVEINAPKESVHADLPDVELVVPEAESIAVPSNIELVEPESDPVVHVTPDFVLEVPDVDPVEHFTAEIELIIPDVDPVEHVEANIELVAPETDLF